jgi:hypothetical protein
MQIEEKGENTTVQIEGKGKTPQQFRVFPF